MAVCRFAPTLISSFCEHELLHGGPPVTRRLIGLRFAWGCLRDFTGSLVAHASVFVSIDWLPRPPTDQLAHLYIFSAPIQ